MPDQFTEVTTIGYGGRIIKSIKSVIVGLIFFVSSFGLLYWNEGRVDLSKIAKTATQINSEEVSTSALLNGKLISTAGKVSANQVIGDHLYLNPGRYVAVMRRVEMYSWVEKKESETRINIGGSETKTTTYNYSKRWTESPEPAGQFKHPEGHENPTKSLDNYTNKVTDAKVGVYSFDPQSITLPRFYKLPLSFKNLTLSDEAVLASDRYIFIKKNPDGTFDNPQVGDLRISYDVLPPGFEGTIFGILKGDKVDPYFGEKGNRLYRLFVGTHEKGIAALHNEYEFILWMLRLAGFLLMWFGLMIFFGPINILLDILPVVGALSRAIIGSAAFVIAFVLTIITILVSIILHSLIALIIAIAIAVGIITFFAVTWKRKKKARIYEK